MLQASSWEPPSPLSSPAPAVSPPRPRLQPAVRLRARASAWKAGGGGAGHSASASAPPAPPAPGGSAVRALPVPRFPGVARVARARSESMPGPSSRPALRHPVPVLPAASACGAGRPCCRAFSGQSSAWAAPLSRRPLPEPFRRPAQASRRLGLADAAAGPGAAAHAAPRGVPHAGPDAAAHAAPRGVPHAGPLAGSREAALGRYLAASHRECRLQPPAPPGQRLSPVLIRTGRLFRS